MIVRKKIILNFVPQIKSTICNPSSFVSSLYEFVNFGSSPDEHTWARLVNTFITNATPFFVAVASFTAFVLIDPDNNILTPEIAFVSLNYFNILRRPLVALPSLIVSLVQALVSVARINRFLRADEYNPDVSIS